MTTSWKLNPFWWYAEYVTMYKTNVRLDWDLLATVSQHCLLRAGCRIHRQEREYLKYVPLYAYFDREPVWLASRLLDNTIIVWGMQNMYQFTRTPSSWPSDDMPTSSTACRLQSTSTRKGVSQIRTIVHLFRERDNPSLGFTPCPFNTWQYDHLRYA